MKRKVICSLIIGTLLCSLAAGVGYSNIAQANTVTVDKIAQNITYYRVVAGSFKNIDNAEKMVENLKDKGIDSFISTEYINGVKYNRVIAGSFKKKSNAENMVSKLEDENIHSFIVTFIVDENMNNTNDKKNDDKENIKKEKYYLVVVGSYKKVKNAEKMVNKLKDKKIDSYIVSKTIDGVTYNRVVVGTFENKENADNMKEQFEELGYDVFVDTWIQ